MTSQSPQKYSIAVPKYKRDVLLHPYTQHAIQLFKSYSFPSIETAILTPGISPYPSWIASAASWGTLYLLTSASGTFTKPKIGPVAIYATVATTTISYLMETFGFND
ncbi:hypothetical protein BATDEDRAFT_24043 [Batrachochytrium dendrobatidis JAM81]|uniref:Uncharacterized protein n=2 Tax=Batrachochytrium dendrobatidis TaxID=109871 RepID=F4NZR5_BATDJ|nr:uncharacterized protein BATDEDRAFT_24043 [Batrachochytrium dendrobatidis JAM81]EGF81231.1 hypothetical protein BATDEDRAFT_24043 [Batrachochytrium dendrobatidis JAM81]OAJ38249.1 hypothetical protein BDEG_22198 [Batrachochytrium dendrobatidis JEL423]|eukprot:XP_006677896.1 hypothetical protein BATDEDRAFT_24043 [Batrachochytrium dendrobatidis JAM81]